MLLCSTLDSLKSVYPNLKYVNLSIKYTFFYFSNTFYVVVLRQQHKIDKIVDKIVSNLHLTRGETACNHCINYYYSQGVYVFCF
jgi:hypothetical protein